MENEGGVNIRARTTQEILDNEKRRLGYLIQNNKLLRETPRAQVVATGLECNCHKGQISLNFMLYLRNCDNEPSVSQIENWIKKGEKSQSSLVLVFEEIPAHSWEIREINGAEYHCPECGALYSTEIIQGRLQKLNLKPPEKPKIEFLVSKD